jgi:DNA helicase-2/ATP-dependent DNA helicase PcrA
VVDILKGLDEGKREAVETTEGPLLVLAGPGSGKTLTLVRRTLNIIDKGLAKPEEIVLCSFTEKSAHELKERIARDAGDLGITQDLSGLVVGTIHGICNDLIEKHRHETNLGNSYDVLDDMTQKFFFFQNFNDIVAPDHLSDDEDEDTRRTYIGGKYNTKWTAIKGLLEYFDKIAEELIDPDEMAKDANLQTAAIAETYKKYLEVMQAKNKVDFAHLQKIALDLLKRGIPQEESPTKYVMVDEFQDTNYVQDALVAQLAAASNNLCVVGDEDQALYRFRGATVENILRFPERHSDVKVVELNVNYRSEPRILKTFTDFIQSHDWSNPRGADFRFEKKLEPADFDEADHPSVLKVIGTDAADEANQIADLILQLKESEAIEDYSQVAVLLHSVKEDHSDPFTAALKDRGIKYFCPRAKKFFANKEVEFTLGSLAFILDWTDGVRGEIWGRRVGSLAEYLDAATLELLQEHPKGSPLRTLLDKLRAEVSSLKEAESLDKRVADYIYLLAGADPFTSWMTDQNAVRNLATLSKFFAVFHQYYGYPVITHKNLTSLRNSFFTSFLSFLHEGGADEYEDPDSPFPKEHVQIMTIHQSKGLEFPVIIAGSLYARGSNQTKEKIERLGAYMHRTPFEPPKSIGEFDAMRLFYVSFSRAEKLLVLTNNDEKKAHKRFTDLLAGIPQLHKASEFSAPENPWNSKASLELKKSYSFTSDIKTYETCSRQYGFYREFEFAPSRAVTILFGTLVHQTIEDVHRKFLAGKGEDVTELFIEERFEFNYKMLQLKEVRSMADPQKKAALQNVIHYWKNNKQGLDSIQGAEIDVSLEKDSYVLKGSIDLIADENGELEILDFKTGKVPEGETEMLRSYYLQLCIYAHIFEQRHGKTPSRLVLYWTGEYDRKKARMVFPYKKGDVDGAMGHFESVVKQIQARNYDVEHAPSKEVCNECDFRSYCRSLGTIE